MNFIKAYNSTQDSVISKSLSIIFFLNEEVIIQFSSPHLLPPKIDKNQLLVGVVHVLKNRKSTYTRFILSAWVLNKLD